MQTSTSNKNGFSFVELTFLECLKYKNVSTVCTYNDCYGSYMFCMYMLTSRVPSINYDST